MTKQEQMIEKMCDIQKQKMTSVIHGHLLLTNMQPEAWHVRAWLGNQNNRRIVAGA
jgi:hypothetical protein